MLLQILHVVLSRKMDETSTSSAPSQAIEMVESSSMASPQKRPRMDDSHGDERVSRRGRNGRGSGNPRARGDRGGSKKKTDMGRAQWRCVILEDPCVSLD